MAPDNSSTDEEQPRNQRRVERKTIVGIRSTTCTDLCTEINKSKARKIEGAELKPQTADLYDQLNSKKSDDLRIKLNRSKNSDLRRHLEEIRRCPTTSPKITNTVVDLRARLEYIRTARTPHLNVIMGGLPPCGDSVRAVKNYRRHATTSQKWLLQIKDDHQITFSASDTHGLHTPHNDPLLIDIGIGDCQVTKILIDTRSSVDLIFREKLDKMGIDLRDMKPSSRTLTGFNGASEPMIGMIHVLVYVGGVTRTVKFSVIRAKAPYNAILGTPWLHSMKAIPSTYHQCIKFPERDGTIQTIRGDQKAAQNC
ncbi:hypothetical protein N665_0195s0015 [Sinapis alba]|nr:hypothetical protein N665_0195s0015 [Sinapis alba]